MRPTKRPPRAAWRLTPLLTLAAAGILGMGILAPAAPAAESTIPNNLSFPAIWSDGVALTVPGTFGSAKLTVQDPATGLYLQGVADPADPTGATSANIWQAENAMAIPGTPVDVSQIDWGDNLEAKSLSLGKPVRVETTLLKDLSTTMKGYTMKSASGTKNTEVFGTDGTTYDSTQATVYSACARLTIQRLEVSRNDPYLSLMTWDANKGEWIGTKLVASAIVNSGVWSGGEGSGYSAEINGSGKAIYGYNWTTSNLAAGDYRITFSLDPNCPTAALNTFITPDTSVYVTPTEETAALVAQAGSGSGGSATGGVPKIDAVNNLSYIDVELGSPAYEPYVPAPANTTLPVISGSPVEGQTLSTTAGSWDNNPTSYSYQWQVCDSTGAICGNVNDATAAGYKLGAADVGHTVRVLVTATNDTGPTTVASAPTAVVTALPSPPTTNPQQDQGARKLASQIRLQMQWLTQTRARVFGWVQPRHDGRRLMIQQRTRTGWRTVASVRLTKQTQQRSQFTLTLNNLAAGVYRAYLGGDTVYAESASSHMTIRALVRLTTRLQVLAQHRVRLSGTVTPRHDGQRAMIQMRTRSGWRTVARVQLRTATQQRSQYAITLARLKRGTYRVYLNGDPAHRPSASASVTVR